MAEETLVADAQRPVGKSAARKIRREGKVPAIVYGQGVDPEAVAVPSRDLQHILSGVGGMNTLINLDLSGRSELVLARQIVRHPVKHTLVHLDFIRIRRDQAVTAEVPIHLVGEAIGVKEGGLLEQDTFTLSIEAKPGDQLTVADLALPSGVVSTQDPGDLVAHVSTPVIVDLGEAPEAAEGEEGEEVEGGEGEGGEAPSAEAGEGASAEGE
jgi:large subunit ribosomal protein L25